MPTGGGIDQFFQRREQPRVGFRQSLTARSTTTKPVIDRLVRMRRPVVRFPALIVFHASPVASATAVTPPQPKADASLLHTSRVFVVLRVV